MFAAHEKDGGAFIGWFCLRPESQGPLDEVELGYRLRQAAWGKGYATEGSRALLGKAFTELGVRMVWAETMAVNHGSRTTSWRSSPSPLRERPFCIHAVETGG
ncbi:GNAT family N-acetyltransferase [Streptomyces sp. NPDC047869]|uniref:GNAT family N-acetyltransferase n=1 Tax=Streptomyces sp. NPDC047869 TaxID=3154709 RepID=UPI00345305D6